MNCMAGDGGGGCGDKGAREPYRETGLACVLDLPALFPPSAPATRSVLSVAVKRIISVSGSVTQSRQSTGMNKAGQQRCITSLLNSASRN